MKGKRVLAVFWSVMVMVIALSACQSAVLNEEELIRKLPEDTVKMFCKNPFDTNQLLIFDFEVISLEVEKRNTERDTDDVYCVVEMENEFYRYTKYLRLDFTYYEEGGWQRDNWDYYRETEFQVLSSPFDVETVQAAVELQYPEVKYTGMEERFDENAVVYCFVVNKPHENGSYSGEYRVECRFDGANWFLTKDNSDVEFVWEIEGTWRVEKEVSGPYGYTYSMTLQIEEFDQKTGKLTGNWSASYNKYWFQYSLNSGSSIAIDIDPGKVIEISNHPEYAFTHRSFVRIHPDKVEGMFREGGSNPGLKRLNKITVPQTSSGSAGNNAQISEDKGIRAVIERYFEIAEKNDVQEIVNAFPSCMGDDIGIYGKKMERYTVVEGDIASDTMSPQQIVDYGEALRDEELYGHVVPAEDYAGCNVDALFTDGTQASYCFRLCKYGDVWELLYVDEPTTNFL